MREGKARLIRATTGDPMESASSSREKALKAGEKSLVQPRFFSKMFLSLWAILFMVLFSAFYTTGLAPEGAREIADAALSFLKPESFAAETNTPLEEPQNVVIPDMPPQIIIPAIGANSEIQFPESSDLNILNTALTRGVVHYPHSVLPGQIGNAFFFGHSTGLAVVHNKAYEALNGLKTLKEGDVIKIRMARHEYLYLVTKTYMKRYDDARIDLISDKKMLTLSTCRIFGDMGDRYIVEAEFLRSYPLRTLALGK